MYNMLMQNKAFICDLEVVIVVVSNLIMNIGS